MDVEAYPTMFTQTIGDMRSLSGAGQNVGSILSKTGFRLR